MAFVTLYSQDVTDRCPRHYYGRPLLKNVQDGANKWKRNGHREHANICCCSDTNAYPVSPTRSWYCRISACNSSSSSRVNPSNSCSIRAQHVPQYRNVQGGGGRERRKGKEVRQGRQQNTAAAATKRGKTGHGTTHRRRAQMAKATNMQNFHEDRPCYTGVPRLTGLAWASSASVRTRGVCHLSCATAARAELCRRFCHLVRLSQLHFQAGNVHLSLPAVLDAHLHRPTAHMTAPHGKKRSHVIGQGSTGSNDIMAGLQTSRVFGVHIAQAKV